MRLPAHNTKVGDWVRPCRTDYDLSPHVAYAEPEFKRVIEITAFDLVVRDGPWKFPCQSWIRKP